MANANGLLEGLKLLLVDDDEDCRQFISLALQTEGASLVEAADAEQAVEILKTQTFDLVATDKNLPNMDGIGLIQHIRQTHGTLPVILITGFGSINSAVDALKFGAQDYLVKPIEDTDVLFRAIRGAVQHHRLATENKILQDKLLQAQRMESVGVLAGGVAHELNNTLEPIIGLPSVISEQLDTIWAQLGQGPDARPDAINDRPALESGAPDLQAIKEQLHIMERSGRRAAAVVTDLMTFSESGLYRKEPQDLNAIIRRSLDCPEIAELRALNPGISIRTDLAASSHAVSGSGSHLERVLVNLLRNSFQAILRRMQTGETFEPLIVLQARALHLETRHLGYEAVEPGDYLTIEVADSGVGIAVKDLGRIFEPFYITRQRSGSAGPGMGLSIVYRVIKDHGGSLDVQSQAGQGTLFKLFLPVEKAPAPPAAAPVSGAGHRVLVVDDEAAARQVAKFLLTRLGYQVTAAANGHEALKLFQEAKSRGEAAPFHVMLLDMVMEEGFDGLATFEEIIKLYPDQKVIAASGFAPTERAKNLIDRGAGWLGKPYGLQELSHAVTQKLAAAG